MYVRSFVVSITSMSLTLFWLASKQINIPESFQVWWLFFKFGKFLNFYYPINIFLHGPISYISF